MFSTANDYLFFVDPETVTLYDASGNNLGAVTGCQRLGGDLRERAPSHGEYLGYHVTWRLPQPNVSATIVPGYKVMDSRNYVHVVQSVSNPGIWEDSWNCMCLALNAMGHTVQIGVPIDSSDAYTSPITSQTYGAPEPAAIQEVSKELVVHNKRQCFRYKYKIWLLSEPRLAYGTLVRDERGYVYQVESQSDRRRIDELVALDCIIYA